MVDPLRLHFLLDLGIGGAPLLLLDLATHCRMFARGLRRVVVDVDRGLSRRTTGKILDLSPRAIKNLITT